MFGIYYKHIFENINQTVRFYLTARYDLKIKSLKQVDYIVQILLFKKDDLHFLLKIFFISFAKKMTSISLIVVLIEMKFYKTLIF